MKKFYGLILCLSLSSNSNGAEYFPKPSTYLSNQCDLVSTPQKSSDFQNVPVTDIINIEKALNKDTNKINEFCAFFEKHSDLKKLLYFVTNKSVIEHLYQLIITNNMDGFYYYKIMMNKTFHK